MTECCKGLAPESECACAKSRIAELEEALRRVVADVNDYERANKLHPNPGRTECWDSVAHAKRVLANQQ
jgi:hypothetical protein